MSYVVLIDRKGCFISYYVGALEFLVTMLTKVICYIFCLPRLSATNFAYQASQVQVLVTKVSKLRSVDIGHKAAVSW